MKSSSLIIILFCFIIFTGSKCKKDGLPETLPVATQEGKNTMGFKINGKVWTPYSQCGFAQNPCGAIQLNYHLNNVPAYYLSFGCSRKYNGDNASFGISSLPGTTISSIGNKFDSINIVYTNYAAPGGWVDYGKSANPKGSFIITKLDFTNQIISGIFDCTLYSGTDSVVITDGRFDCKFYTCVCN